MVKRRTVTSPSSVAKVRVEEVADKNIIENIKWFSQFSPLKKLAIYEREVKRSRKFRGLALKYYLNHQKCPSLKK